MDKTTTTIIHILKEFYFEKNDNNLSIKSCEEPVIEKIRKKIISFEGMINDTNFFEKKQK